MNNSGLKETEEFVVRGIKFEDFRDIVDAYYSYYSEIKENPELGITLLREMPSIGSEVDWFRDLYKGVLDGNRIAFVAEADGKAIGICEIARNRPGSEEDHVGRLGIAVRKEYRSKGVGKRLMEEALRQASGKFEIVILEVFENNTVATRLYGKMGFREYGFLEGAIKRNGKSIGHRLMYLRIADKAKE
jgi:ribosomal protein S18 acetylase RimI-like enzyme